MAMGEEELRATYAEAMGLVMGKDPATSGAVLFETMAKCRELDATARALLDALYALEGDVCGDSETVANAVLSPVTGGELHEVYRSPATVATYDALKALAEAVGWTPPT